MKFETTSDEDAAILAAWILADADHVGIKPDFFYSGNSETQKIAGKLIDSEGVVLFFRFDCGEYSRFSTQFAPREVVNADRVRAAILSGLPPIIGLLKQDGFKGLIFESASPSLIRFMEKMGFAAVEGQKGPRGQQDYQLYFEAPSAEGK